MRSAFALVALVVLTSCAADRYHWSIAHMSLSPRAKKLPQGDVEEIVKLVVEASSSTVLSVGAPCRGASDVINIVVDYMPDRFMLYHVKKIGGHWKIVGREDASPTLTGLFDL